MILVKTANKQFALIFAHKMAWHKPLEEMEPIKVRATQCEIFEVDEKGHLKVPRLSRGIAKCSLMDNFVKAIGRKIALTRALDDETSPHKFSKYERTVIWDAYFKRR